MSPATTQGPGATTAAASRPPAPARPRMHALAQRVEGLRRLDAAAKPVGAAVRGAVPPGPVRDALSGRPLGHALHPFLTDLAIGSWTSAAILDVVGGRTAEPGARRLIAFGVASSLPTAATGLLDWADTEPVDDEVRRVGVVHALANVAALACFGGSLAARRRGRTGRGRALAAAGMGALTVGAHLGAHLSYAKAVGVDATALGPALDGWTEAGPALDLPEGEPACREAGGRTLLLVRHAGVLRALDDRCAHRGGPLHDGEVADGCVTCPLHGSRFRLADGSVERGPSPYPQPTYDVRERDGRIEVRPAHGAPTL